MVLQSSIFAEKFSEGASGWGKEPAVMIEFNDVNCLTYM